jgi:hypothetical protein
MQNRLEVACKGFFSVLAVSICDIACEAQYLPQLNPDTLHKGGKEDFIFLAGTGKNSLPVQ